METQEQQAGIVEKVQAGANVTRVINTLSVSANAAYFQIQYTVDFHDEVPETLHQHYKPSLLSGFARHSDICAFLAGSVVEIKPIQQMRVVPSGFREEIRRQRFTDAFSKHQAALAANIDLLAGLQDGSIDHDDIVEIDIGAHLLFDRHGQILPVGIVFNFMHGGMHSGRYHLEKALEILLKDPRVLPAPNGSRDAHPGIKISRVGEDFSTDDYSQKHIHFLFAPTVADMRAIWDKCNSYVGNYPSTKMRDAIFDLDLLGLRAGGAAKYETYYGEDTPEPESEED